MALALGCEPQPEITSRTVDKTEPRQAFDVGEKKERMDHTLVAVLPTEEKAWFFKITGPSTQVESRRKEFLKFLESLGPASEKDAPPSWELPETWQEKEGSQMRAATLKMSSEPNAAEIAVSSLPISDDWDSFLYRNVERWMGQLDQRALPKEAIEKLSNVIETPAGKVTVLHLAGLSRPKPMANPHGGQAKDTATAPDRKEATSSAGGGGLKYDTPSGWNPGRLSAMRKAAFEISQADQKAEVTVISLPVAGGPQISDVTANVSRWAGQVGLTDLDEAAIGELVETKQIDGTEASYVALLGAESDSQPRGMLAAMCVKDGKVWFFKLFGDRPLVVAEQQNFSDYLDSVRFE